MHPEENGIPRPATKDDLLQLASNFNEDLYDEQTKAFLAKIEPMDKEWAARLGQWHGTQARAKRLDRASNAELRLLCGELTSSEIRTIRAVVKFILANT